MYRVVDASAESSALAAAAGGAEGKGGEGSEGGEGGAVVGYFYLDMHPREGKYGHAACFTLQSGCDTPWWAEGEEATVGGRQLPVAACVCNFPRGTGGKPACLPHSDVVTFFHEFGHVMHVLCSKTKFSRFAGTRVERDFVEAPSQMLENWCYEPEPLARMSGHKDDPSTPLPAEMAKALQVRDSLRISTQRV